MDSRYIPMTEADCRQTCATLRQMLASRTKEITELKEKNADLLAKVSEQEKEIERLKGFAYNKIVSEQSQRIQELTEQVEKLKQHTEKQFKEIRNLAIERDTYRDGIKKYCHHMHIFFSSPRVGQPPDINDLKSLLSKFEVPNQS